ncbi:MAG: hypothetical protein HQL62_01950, partial [Magnetococcales bacterium]|nr:hypothetical protein [Magnetococcales bacterium]
MKKLIAITGTLCLMLLTMTMTTRQGMTATQEAEILGRVVVFVNEGCHYCQAFDREIAKAYPKTDIGQHLPMVRVDTFDPPKEYAVLAKEMCFTPTILVLDSSGVERARF